MKTMNKQVGLRAGRFFAGALALAALGACSVLSPSATPPPAFYSLDSARVTVAVPAPPAAQALPKGPTPTLIVNPPLAAAGFDSPRIIYVREPHKLEYFANSEWVDPPARMIATLIIPAIESTGTFRAVVSAPGSATGDLRLETEVLLLQHEFGQQPSRVRFGLRAYLVEEGTRRVVATRDFEAVEPAPSEDPYGGVQAANTAVKSVLESLAAFCAETATAWQPSRKPAQSR